MQAAKPSFATRSPRRTSPPIGARRTSRKHPFPSCRSSSRKAERGSRCSRRSRASGRRSTSRCKSFVSRAIFPWTTNRRARSRSSPRESFEDERHFHREAVFENFPFLDLRFLRNDLEARDAADRLRRTLDALLRGILPPLLRRR